jgi:MFS family permease
MDADSPQSIIKNKGFLNLWINQILVQLSYNCLNFGLLVWVYHLTQSSLAVSLMLFSVYLPSVIFGLFAGVLVDITDRKKIIMIINLLLAVCFIALIPFKASFMAILVIVFLVNSLVQFYVPAESSAIPLICKRDQLLAANSLFSITLFGSFLAGFGIAGPLINMFDINFVFGFGAVLLMIAFFLSFLFPPIKSDLDPLGRKLVTAFEEKNIAQITEVGIKEMKNTFYLIKGRIPVTASLFILASVQVAIAVLGALIPSFFERTLKINATDASFILVLPLGIGMVLGGVLLSRWGHILPKRTIVSTGIATAGLLFFILGVAPLLAPLIEYLPMEKTLSFVERLPLSTILISGSFMLGLSMVSIVVPSQTALQEYSPERDRGKVYAALSVLMSALTLVPVILAGISADYFGVGPIFIAMGGTVALLGLMALKPDFYFSKKQLSPKIRRFLGVGHWRKLRERMKRN